jgi:Ni,Fe-hydrogenase I cytochrome b subunit
MKPNSIFLVKVWPVGVRAAHWSMAAGFVVLMVTGWILDSGRYLGEAPVDFHYLAAYLLLAGLALRLWVLATHPAVGSWRALWPSAEQLRAVPAMVKFYLSFGRLDPPRWFAHNPFWAPLYLVWILALVIQAGLGIALIQGWGELAAVQRWHAGLAQALVAVFGFHVVAVVLHELKVRRCDVSAMIHGFRVFDLPPVDASAGDSRTAQVVRLTPRGSADREGGDEG